MTERQLAAIEGELKEYILGVARDHGHPLDDLDREDDFIEAQVFDSLSLLDFIMHVEQVVGVKIPPEDVVPENFGSLAATSAYLRDTFGLT